MDLEFFLYEIIFSSKHGVSFELLSPLMVVFAF
jgi:hypothetical protein